MKKSQSKSSNVTRRFVVLLALASVASTSWADKTINCYVSGDTSGNNTNKPIGGSKNPYGSLAAVQAPIITNSSPASNGGLGVNLSSDNVIKHVHIKDTWASGVFGLHFGKLTIQNSHVTGAGQSGTFLPLPDAENMAWPNIFLLSAINTDININHSDFGESIGASLMVVQIGGHGQVQIDTVTVSDQGVLDPDAFMPSQGIGISTHGAASVDVLIKDTSVSDIGGGNSNSDGIYLINSSSGDFVAEIDGYSYINPDGDGGHSATGLEIGLNFAVGGSFTASVKNSVIEGSATCGIQVLDLGGVGGNTLDVKLQDNLLIGNATGVCGWQAHDPGTSLTDFSLDMKGNAIYGSTFVGIDLWVYGPISSFDVLLEGNTVVNSGIIGLWPRLNGNVTGSYNVDAGLGALGSTGQNRIIGSGTYDVLSEGMDVTAANNWWGSATGPSSVLALDGATVVVDPFLTIDPD